MFIRASEIKSNQHLKLKGFKSYRILNKIKETAKTITFSVNYYFEDSRCIGDFIEKDVTFRKSTIVESREDNVGTKFDQLYRIKSDRLKKCISKGFQLYKVKALTDANYQELEIGDYMFAKWNGVNYITESILDDGPSNSIPPSLNSDKPYISGWDNSKGGFEDYYDEDDIQILIKIKNENKSNIIS